MNTIENNKLIAIFMGHEIAGPGFEAGFFINKDYIQFDELKYHTSWDWLMPVLDKIYSSDAYIDYKGTLGQFNEGIVINTKYISVTYEQVVEFIVWYNKNN